MGPGGFVHGGRIDDNTYLHIWKLALSLPLFHSSSPFLPLPPFLCPVVQASLECDA